jgi:hypothetical protein
VLQNATLNGARLDRAILQGARADDATNWPDEFDPRAAGVLAPPPEARAGSGGTVPA